MSGFRAEQLERRVLLAAAAPADPVLVRDIDPTNEPTFGLGGSNVVSAGRLAFIAAPDARFGIYAQVGEELWATDGDSTWLVKDINPGPAGSVVEWATAVGDRLFFMARHSPQQRTNSALWTSDGTAAGTRFVADLYAHSLTAVGDTLFFVRYGSTGDHLWKSDGTAGGTVEVYQGPPGSTGPSGLVDVGGTLYFAMNAGAGWELWKSDGTAAGTAPVKDIRPGAAGSSPLNLTAVGETLFFTADDGSGRALWKSDGTPQGTVLLKKILPDPARPTGFNHFFTPVGRDLYFAAYDSAHGAELWRSDGTPDGTAVVRDLRPGPASSNPAYLGAAGGALYFSADDGVAGAELWRSDGTEDGTALVKDVNASPGGSTPSGFVDVGGYFLFSADDGKHGFEPWRSDGTPEGTFLLKDVRPGAAHGGFGYPSVANGKVVFAADDGVHGSELWATDGTAGGTRLVGDISTRGYGSDPAGGAAVDGTLFFNASDRGAANRALWKTDGTAGGTARVSPRVGAAALMAPLGGRLHFVARGDAGFGLWQTDGTDAGTALVKPLSASALYTVTEMAPAGPLLYFVARDQTTAPHRYELWRSDGTPAGTTLLRAFDRHPSDAARGVSGLTAYGGRVYFAAQDAATGEELWASDGTAAGTVLVRDINPGAAQSSVRYLTAGADGLYFGAYDGTAAGLWRTDGTSAGTALVKGLRYGIHTVTSGNGMVGAGGKVFFGAYDDEAGLELWTSDGTGAGTRRVADVRPGTAGGGVENLTAAGDAVYFNATDGVWRGGSLRPGSNLYRSDGTPEGTVRVKSVDAPNPQGWMDHDSSATFLNGTLLFTAHSPDGGWSLWRSDGTEAGTVAVAVGDDVGQHEPTPVFLGVLGDRLLFGAWDRELGMEPWAVAVPGAPPTQVSGRQLFYNGSAFDGRDPAATAADLAAVAPDKAALAAPADASFANVTSHSKGITGVLVTFAGTPSAALDASDFDFRIGVGGDPDSWPRAAPAAVVRLPDPTAAADTARYAVTFPAGAIRNLWLRVTVKAGARTGLDAPDVFYFGSLVGDTGTTPLRNDARDYLRVRSALGRAADLSNPYDLDRDGRVGATDLALARGNLGRSLPAVAPAAPSAVFAAGSVAAYAPRRRSALDLLNP